MKIVFKSNRMSSGFEELHGHACDTEAQMHQYCQQLNPAGDFFKVVDDSFDCGHYVTPPKPQAPAKVKPLNPESVKVVLAALADAKAKYGIDFQS